uniref:cyclophilin-like fold protein n=1 Tax=Enterocloster clostridioformis TaxID=1531 RepID=UPI003FA43E15
MAVHSFLEEYDFSGKTVIPFVTHGTGGMAGTIDDMTASLPDSAVVLESIGISRSEVERAQETVNGWLDELGFTETAADSAQTGEKTIIMTVNGQDIEVLLYDTPAANSLYEMLPLELTFEDYNGTEKISYLPEHLTTDGEPDSFDPDTGDFCLYEPWGNLSIFYQDFQNSSGLISLGRIEEGMDVISAMEGDFVVLLTKTED